MKQRIQRAKFDEALSQAKGGNLDPLHDWLRDLLPDYAAEALAEFHKRRLRRDIGNPLRSAERLAEDEIIGRSINRIRMLRRSAAADDGSDDGTYQRVIDHSAALLAEDGDLGHSDPDRINYKRILKTVRRLA